MTKQIKAEIVSIGTELLLGQIANTNAQWMSGKLAEIGVNTYYHTALGDNMDRLEQTFELAQSRSDVVIVTGGLGPTEDDLSREAFQRMTNLAIIEEPVSLKKIRAYFDKQGRQMTPNNLRQARIFDGSKALDNQVGMAPGIAVTYDQVDWYFLPGVPREMKQIFSDEIMPYLQKTNGDQMIASKILKFIGIGESDIEHQLSDLIQKQTNPTIAPLATSDGITIRITGKANDFRSVQALLDEMKEQVLARVGQYCYGEDDDTIEKTIASLLKASGKSLAAAESLTGGAFSEKIVSVPGTSSYYKGSIVCYERTVKENVLGIPKEITRDQGTVSQACAVAMARNVARLLDSDIGISFTGIAGPDAIEGQPVGTVFITLHDQAGYEETKLYQFSGDREQIRRRAVMAGYERLFVYL